MTSFPLAEKRIEPPDGEGSQRQYTAVSRHREESFAPSMSGAAGQAM